MKQSELKRISAHFRRSIHTYEDGALVQREVGDYLVNLINDYPDICFQRVLEVGCCTGAMTERFCHAFSIHNFYVNDLVPECCQSTVGRICNLVGNAYPTPGNIEAISLPSELDLVISSSTFQWLKDLPSFFSRIAKRLNDQGYLVFSQFSPGTMRQVKELLGVGLTYSDEETLAAILQDDFTIERLETSHYRIYFQTPRDVLKHIQKTGVGGVVDFRWTPSKLRSFENEYRARFGEEQGVPVDYVSTFAVARKKVR